ncbi:MAG: hypothetical protein ACPGGE_02425 [Poseidonia sp.]
MKRRTLRGQVIEGNVKRLIVDDGRLTRGYRVTKFVIAGDPSSSANDAYGTLALDYDSPRAWDWGDNRQIAWASTNIQATAGSQPFFELVDPNHVVLQDLYIQAQVGSGTGASVCNYLIVLEPMELTNDEAILTLIKERSQDDPR